MGRPVRATKFFHSGDHPTLRLAHARGLRGHGNAQPPRALPRAASPASRCSSGSCSRRSSPAPRRRWPACRRRRRRPDAARARGRVPARRVRRRGVRPTKRAGFNNTDRDYFDDVLDAYDAIVGGRATCTPRRCRRGRELHELDVQNLDAVRGRARWPSCSAQTSATSASPSSCGARRRREARVPAGAVRGRRLVSRTSGGTRSRSRTRRAASSSRRDVQDLLLEFGVVSPPCRYANGEIKLVIGNRRDAAAVRAQRRVPGARSSRSSSRSLDGAACRARRANDTDRIPFLARVRPAESGGPRRRQDVARAAQHRPRPRLGAPAHRDHRAASPSDEVPQVIAPLVSSGWYFATVESVDRRRRAARVLDPRRLRRPLLPRRRFVNHNTESRLAPLAMQLLGEIDEDTVDFTPTYDGNTVEPAGAPGEISQPPGQRRRRDRRRYGDEHPAAQPRGGDRRGAAPARQPRRVGRPTSCSSSGAPTSRRAR